MTCIYENQDPNYFGTVKPAASPENFENLNTQQKDTAKAAVEE